MFLNVFGEINFIEEVVIHSDRCAPQALLKLEEEFKKELVKNKLGYKINIWRLIKDSSSNTADDKDETGESGPPQGDSNENHLSQNSKLNVYIVPGFVKQIQMSPAIQRFHLINYRMSGASWKKLGKAIGETHSLRAFAC